MPSASGFKSKLMKKRIRSREAEICLLHSHHCCEDHKANEYIEVYLTGSNRYQDCFHTASCIFYYYCRMNLLINEKTGWLKLMPVTEDHYLGNQCSN